MAKTTAAPSPESGGPRRDRGTGRAAGAPETRQKGHTVQVGYFLTSEQMAELAAAANLLNAFDRLVDDLIDRAKD